MPKVSVIVPVYRTEAFIARCAESLFGQTLEDIEYIFVDDASPDRSMEVLDAVLEKFPERKASVIRYRMDANSGQAAVRLKGLSLATGDYVIQCDSDDRVEPDAYRRLYEKAVSENLDIVTCDSRRGNDAGWKTVRQHYEPGKELSSLLLGNASWSLCFRLVRRSLYDAPLIEPVSDMGEDMVLTLQTTFRAKKCGHLAEPLYYYYIHAASTTGRPDRDSCIARWKAVKANVDRMLVFLCGEAGFSAEDPEIVAFKYHIRRYLEPLLGEAEGYRLWRETYPETDRLLLKARGIPVKRKLLYLMMRCRLPVYRKK